MKKFKLVVVVLAFWICWFMGTHCAAMAGELYGPKINADLEVALAGGSAYSLSAGAQPGDAVCFKVFLMNTGKVAGKHPQIRMTLDPRLTYIARSSSVRVKRDNRNYDVALSDAMIPITDNTITWGFTDMAPQASASLSLSFQARVASDDRFAAESTTLAMSAVASFESDSLQKKGTSGQTNRIKVIVTRNLKPTAMVVLHNDVSNISLQSPDFYHTVSAAPGDTIGFRLTLVNTGNLTLHNVAVKDLLPDGVEFSGNFKLFNQANPEGLTIPGNDILKDGQSLTIFSPGTINSQTLVFTAKVVKANSGTSSSRRRLTNRAQVVFPGGVAAEAVASLSINSRRALIVECEVLDPVDNEFKPAIGSVKEGQLLTYRVNVQNNGTISILHPNLQIALPPQLLPVPQSVGIDSHITKASTQENLFNSGLILTDAAPGMIQVITFQVRASQISGLKNFLPVTASVKDNKSQVVSDVAVTQVQAPSN